MKITLISKISLKWSLVLAALLSIGGTSVHAGNVLPPAALPYGFSYEEWSQKWWQWNLGQATNDLQWVASPGICEGPGSHVRFLAGAPGTTTETRRVNVSDETPLFFSVLSVWVDNTGCATNGHQDFSSFTPDQLSAIASEEWSAVTEITCTIDGVPVPGMGQPTNSAFLVEAPAFSYTTAQKDNVLANIYGVPCIPGGMTIFPAVAEGIYVMLAPLSPGKHIIHYVGIVGPVSAPFIKEDITYDVNVVRGLSECYGDNRR